MANYTFHVGGQLVRIGGNFYNQRDPNSNDFTPYSQSATAISYRKERSQAGLRGDLPDPRRAVGQRTQLINAIRGHLTEYGLIAPQGPPISSGWQIEDPASDIPPAARVSLCVLVCAFRHLQEQTATLNVEIATRAKADDTARRLTSVPGIGPPIATAIKALAPPVETFRSGRDFAAWVG